MKKFDLRMICGVLLLAFILPLACGCAGEYEVATVTDENGETHTLLYDDGLPAQKLKDYFCEVVMGSEFFSGEGDKALVQRWNQRVGYHVDGLCSESDIAQIEEFFALMEDIDGFPGAERKKSADDAVLLIHFLSKEDFTEAARSVVNYAKADGCVTYRFANKTNEILTGEVFYNTEMAPEKRRGVIFEELYNGMGAPEDTVYRKDSIIYQFETDASELSDTDLLIMKLLYSPLMKCGMNKDEACAVIDKLYY